MVQAASGEQAAVRHAAKIRQPRRKQQLLAFFASLERELEKVEFFRPPDKRETMQINLRNIFTRMQPTQQDIQTLHGVIMAIAEGRKGPARGGVLDGEEAEMLRALLAEHGAGRVPKERGPVRGLARLLRRNPTEAERALWQALVNDRRFAGRGFKRQTPVGQHICDFVSFPLRLVIDLVPADETAAAAAGARAENARGSRRMTITVVRIFAGDVESDMAATLDRIDHAIGSNAILNVSLSGRKSRRHALDQRTRDRRDHDRNAIGEFKSALRRRSASFALAHRDLCRFAASCSASSATSFRRVASRDSV